MSRDGEELTLRSFRPEDQKAVRQLILDGLGDHFAAIDATLNPDLDDIGASYVKQDHEFLVALASGQIVGAGALITLDERVGRIVRVSVARGYRRRGIAAGIVTRLIELGREKQFRRLVVETNLDWYGAIALYLNCGFRPYDRDEVSLHMDLILGAACLS